MINGSVDLDGLWQGTLDRAERARLRHAEDDAATANASSGNSSSSGIATPGGQRRGFHTGRRYEAEVNATEAAQETSDLAESSGLKMTTESLMEKLAKLSQETARAELGTGPEDTESTQFLQLLHSSLPADINAEEKATLLLRLFVIGVSRQHAGFSKELLLNQFSDFLAEYDTLPDNLGFDIVSALLTPRVEESSQEPASFLPDADVELALQVLERLSLRGVPIMNMKVFNMLYDVAATAPAPTIASEEAKATLENRRQMIARLSKVVSTAEVSFDETEARKLMFTQFECQDYDGFWRLWRKFPLQNAPRTQEDYTRLFQLHAKLGDERRARECLSAWVPMMSRENVPIILQGPIVNAIMECILVADPEIEYREEDGTRSYFMGLWAQCQRALDQAGEGMEDM